MLVVRTRDAPPSPRRRRKRPKQVEPDAGDPVVPLTSIIVIRPERFGDDDAASRWLAKLRDDAEGTEREIREAVAVANRALHAHRGATLDPYLADLSAEHALAVRVGHGNGDGLADGRWDEAIEIPPSDRRRRAEALRPQERVAQVLAGREQVAACEPLLLRARADLDQGRTREAALQLRAGLEALLAEIRERTGSRQAKDLAALDARRRQTGEAANEALRGELTDERVDELTETLRLCERVLRRRLAHR